MENDVYRFGQNAREGQWRPLWSNRMDRKGFCPLPQSPPVKQGGSYWTIRETNHKASYTESSGERLFSSDRPSQWKEKVFGWVGDLKLGSPAAVASPVNTARGGNTAWVITSEELRGGARTSRMPVSVRDGRTVTVVLNPPSVPIGYHPARALSPSGCSESMETSIWSLS